MRATLKIVALLALVGCEAGAPASPSTARAEMETAVAALEREAGATELPRCHGGETRVYACDFGDRVLTVCAAPARLSYRFGDDHKTDLEIVSRPGRVRAWLGSVIGGGGGGQTHIRFTNNGYQYIVYTMEAGSLHDEPGKQSSGLTLLHGEGVNAPVVREMQCPQAGEAQTFGDPRQLAGAALPDEGEGEYDAWF